MSDRGKAEFSVMDMAEPSQNVNQGTAQTPHIGFDLLKKKDFRKDSKDRFESLDNDLDVDAEAPQGLVTKGGFRNAADRITRGVMGATVGAVPGAIIGAASDSDDRVGGAKRGAGIGALSGAAGGLISRVGMGERAAAHLQGLKKGQTLKDLTRREANRIPVAGAVGGTAGEIVLDKGIKTLASKVKRIADDALAPRRMLIREYPIAATTTAGTLGALAGSEAKEIDDSMVVDKGLFSGVKQRLKQKAEGVIRGALLNDVTSATEKAARDEVRMQSTQAERNVMEEVKRQGKEAREAAIKEVGKRTAQATGIGAGTGAAVGAVTGHLAARKAEEKGIETVPAALNTRNASTMDKQGEPDPSNVPQSFATGAPIVEKKGIGPGKILGGAIEAAGIGRGKLKKAGAALDKAGMTGTRRETETKDFNDSTPSEGSSPPKPATPAPNPALGGYMLGTTGLANQAEEMKGFNELDDDTKIENKGILSTIGEHLRPLASLGDDVVAAGVRRVKPGGPTPPTSEQKQKTKGIEVKGVLSEAFPTFKRVGQRIKQALGPAPSYASTAPKSTSQGIVAQKLKPGPGVQIGEDEWNRAAKRKLNAPPKPLMEPATVPTTSTNAAPVANDKGDMGTLGTLGTIGAVGGSGYLLGSGDPEIHKGFEKLDDSLKIKTKGGDIKHVGFEGAEKHAEAEGYDKATAGKIIGAAKAHASAKAKAKNPHLLNTPGHVKKGIVSDVMQEVEGKEYGDHPANHPDWKLRQNWTQGGDRTPEELSRMSFDEHPEVRRAVANHPNAMQRTRERAEASLKSIGSHLLAAGAGGVAGAITQHEMSKPEEETVFGGVRGKPIVKQKSPFKIPSIKVAQPPKQGKK